MNTLRNRVILIVTLMIFWITNSNAATANLLVGQSYQTEISATGYHYISIESVSTTNPSVSVTKMGLVVKATVNAFFHGEATVTAKLRYQLYAGQSYQYRNIEFTISCNDTSVNISPSTLSVRVGETSQLMYGFNRTTHVTPFLQWTSSDDAVVTVNSTGLIKANKIGSATIYLRSNLGSNTAQCNVTVTSNPGNNSGEQETSTADISWYNDGDSIFEISTPSQMLGFRKLVNSGYNFENKTVKLINDIDLSSYNWTTSISNYPNVFKGIFDGDGHSLKIYINKVVSTSEEYYYFGFFGNNWGVIRNLILKGSVNVEVDGNITYCYVGALCGTTGTIESCINEANLTYTRSFVRSTGNEDRIGGLAGNSSDMINCINKGKVVTYTKYMNSNYSNTNNYMIGGIAGRGGDFIGCTNMGYVRNVVSGNSSGMLREFIGGIVGLCTNKVLRCSNIGNIEGNSICSSIGGLIGKSYGDIICQNSYVGKCFIGNNVGGSAAYVCSICGEPIKSKDTYTNNYSASDITILNEHYGIRGNLQPSSSEMKTVEFAEKLGSNYWLGSEGLYPIIKGSPEEYKYYTSKVSDITCYTAKISTNIQSVLGSKVKTWGLLLTLDDGKETYIPGISNIYTVDLSNLSPDRTYRIRWYAQDNAGKEYYGVYATFKTKSLVPVTCAINTIGVSSAELIGQSYVTDATKRGFLIRKNDEADPGKYIWGAISMDNNEFNLSVNNLDGNCTYVYAAAIEIDGIIYLGEELQFNTKPIKTLPPSNFTENNAVLNSEVAYDFDNYYFEFRNTSLPSVIESDIINATREGLSVKAFSPKLNINERYKYRIVAVKDDENYYGEWEEFEFNGASSAEIISYFGTDTDEILIVYDLSGRIVFKGKKSDLNLDKGIYILKQGRNILKIKI